jgi:tetratricopeptide (TPR) repeat protein
VKRTQRTFQNGEVIFREGDIGNAAYVVVSGKVELFKSGQAKDAPPTVVGPGEIFGEMGIVEQGPRAATARAVGTVTVKVIERDHAAKAGADPAAPSRGRGAPAAQPRNDAAAPRPRPGLGGLIGHLLDRLRGQRGDRVEVRIAPLTGDGAAAAARLLAAFAGCKAFRARLLKKPPALKLDRTIADPGAALAAAARPWLIAEKVDLLVVGEVPAPGYAMTLRLLGFASDDEDTPGAWPPGTPLTLPVEMAPEFANMLAALALIVASPRLDGKAAAARAALPAAAEAAMPVAQNPLSDLTAREQASVQFSLGVVTARAAPHGAAAEWHQRAALAFRVAADALTRERESFEWALAQRNLSHELLAIAERSGDRVILKAASEALRAALGGIAKERSPREWAALQNRLGTTLFRLDFDGGDVELLKSALTAVQSSLQVYTRTESPLRWAEAMNSVGQIAQVLGEQLRNADVLEKAAEACRQALEVRRKDAHPLLWATSQNNLGSALFLLGKMRNSRAILENAEAAFKEAHETYLARGAAKLAAVTEKNLARVEPLLTRLGARRSSEKKYWHEVEDGDVEAEAPPAAPKADKSGG